MLTHLSARYLSGTGNEVAKGTRVGTPWGGICPRTSLNSVEGGSGCLLSPPCPVHTPWLAFFQVSSAQVGFQALAFLGGWLVLLFSCSLSNSQALSHAQLGPPSATALPRAVRVVWQMQCKLDSLHPLFQLSTQESLFDAPLWVPEYNRE